jgi:hypothetical protein
MPHRGDVTLWRINHTTAPTTSTVNPPRVHESGRVRARTVQPATPKACYPVNDQSVYLVKGIDLQATTADDDPFSRGVARMTLDELRDKVERAKRAIAAGEVTAQTPVGG